MSNQPLNKKPVVLLPASIYQAMVRYKLTFDDFLDLGKANDVLALSDLCYVLLLNENTQGLLGQSKDVCSKLSTQWSRNNSLFEQLIAIKPVGMGELKNRLCSIESFENNTKCFDIKDISVEALFVIIYPQMFISKEITNSASKELIAGILKVLYGYNEYDTIAKENLFTEYVASL